MKNHVNLTIISLFFAGNICVHADESVFANWTDEQYQHYEDSIINILYPQPISCDNTNNLIGIVGEDDDLKAVQKISELPTSFSLDKSKEPGQISITSGTTPWGAKTYTVPIDVYPGMHNHQPSLSLNYNSQSGNSIMGMGWAVGGLSAITRGVKSIYYDKNAEGVSLKKDDALYLDGERLIRYFSTSSELCYETETGNIKVKGYYSGDIIKYFEVFYPNGNKGVYGDKSSLNSQVIYPISSFVDLQGNEIKYSYDVIDNFHYIKSISYNNASVNFYYDSNRSDPQIFYSGGIKFVIKKTLRDIVCQFGNKTIGGYHLSYTYRNGASLLSKIDYLSSSKAYNPITMYYGADSDIKYYRSSTANLGTFYKFDLPASIRIARGKIDYGKESDGIAVFPNKTPYWQHYRNSTAFRHSEHRFDNYYTDYEEKIYVYPSVQSVIVQPVKISVEKGFIDIFSADLDGKGQDCLIKVNNYADGDDDKIIFKIYSPTTGGSIHLSKTCTFSFNTLIEDAKGAKSIHPKFYYAGDFDGDGKMEILGVSVDSPLGESSRTSRCYIFDLNDGKVRFEKNLFKFTHIFTGTEQSDADDASNKSDKVLVFDYNGDGKTDLCHIDATGLHIYTFDRTADSYSARKVGTYTEINRRRLENRQLLAGDVNGDGLMDIMVSPSSVIGGGYWTMHRSCGNCSFDKEETRIVKNDDSIFTGFVAQDLNGDGKCDLVNYRSTRFDSYLSNGSGISSTAIGEEYSSSKGILIPVDVNSFGSHVQLIFLKDDKITKYTYTKSGHKDYLLTCLVNSLGVIEHNAYGRLGEDNQIHQKGSGSIFPYVNINDGLEVLTNTTVYLDGVKQKSKNYTYANAVFHRQGRGFQGFGEIKYQNERNQSYTDTYDPYNFGVLKTQITPENKIESLYNIDVSAGKIAKILLTEKKEEDLLTGNSVNTVYSHDEFGYPEEEITTFDDGSTISIKNVYSSSVDVKDGYNLGFLTNQVKTVKTGLDTYVERVYIPAYSKRLPIVKVEYKNGNQVKSTTYSYDGNGNVLKESSKLYTGTRLQNTAYEYDAYGRVIKMTDYMNLTTEYGYNEVGDLATVKDFRNGITNYSYDAMHREIKCVYPDSSECTKTYAWNNSETPGLYSIQTEMSGKPLTSVYYDAFDREVRTSKLSITRNNMYVDVSVDKVYDVYGNLKKESIPHYFDDASAWKEYAYDAHNRLTSCTEAAGRTTTYEYSGLSIIETVNGVKKQKTYDVMGRLELISGDEGTIRYVYAPDGQITKTIVSGAPAIEYTYDGYRRKISEKDPAFGLTRYEYDSYGNVSKKVDARNNSTLYKYDAFNRLIRVTADDFSARYQYTSLNDLGGVSVDDKLTKQYSYDRYGRMTRSVETFKDSPTDVKVLRRDYTYEDGNVKTIQYSDRKGKITTEFYGYTRGWLTDVRISGIEPVDTVIYKIEEMNEFDKPVQILSGMALKRNYSYDEYGYPKKRFICVAANNPSQLKAAATNFRTVLNESYLYDYDTNNLQTRTNNIYDTSESFTYDKLDRLTGAALSSTAYDTKGNIIRRSDVGKFSYESVGNTYAMNGAEFVSQFYPSDEQSIEYTSFMRPSRIEENGYVAIFNYDENFERVKMKITHDNKNYLTRYYLGGCYEIDITEENTSEKLYLGGDYYTAPAVLVKRQTTSDWKRYDIARDHLGSVISVVDADRVLAISTLTPGGGYLQLPVSYDPWGRLRDPETLVPYDMEKAPVLALGRGFTGHEHLPMFGLINMNARLYDPLTGRFLSPDPYVQQSESPQNYNRYSYCLNNPLRYTDRSGELFLIDDFILGCIKGIPKAIKNKDWENIFNSGCSHFMNSLSIWGGLFSSDSNKGFLGQYWELLSRFTWQLPQTFLGFSYAHAYNTFGNVEDVTSKYGATVLKTSSIGGAVTLGNFIIGNSAIEANADNRLFQHEYGHYLQSQTFGLAYLYIVGIPSILNASQHTGNHNFQRCEIDANRRAFVYFNKNIYNFYTSREEYSSSHKNGWDFYNNPIMSKSRWNISPYVDYYEINSKYSIFGWKGL